MLTYTQAVQNAVNKAILKNKTYYIHQEGLMQFTVSDVPGTFGCRRVTVEDALAYAMPALAAA